MLATTYLPNEDTPFCDVTKGNMTKLCYTDFKIKAGKFKDVLEDTCDLFWPHILHSSQAAVPLKHKRGVPSLNDITRGLY